MTSPDFPQADPAIRYIADRVSHIEDASYSAASYQASHKKLMQRLSKTDADLARIQHMLNELGEGLGDVSLAQAGTLANILVSVGEMQRDQKTLLNSICADFERLQQTQTEQQDDIALILDRVKHIAVAPFWHLGVLGAICFGAGYLIGGVL